MPVIAGILDWCGNLLREIFFVQDDHPMTQQEYDRWNAGVRVSEIPGRVHDRLVEQRLHNEIISAIRESSRR